MYNIKERFNLTKRCLVDNYWYDIDPQLTFSHINGIELKTSSSEFSLKYRTYATEIGWLPYLTSIENDYAGLPSKPTEALEIKVYDNNGNSLDSKYVVMYRVYCDDKWLAWVSNASPDIMEAIKDTYSSITGTLDVVGSNAGLPGNGLPIKRLEIRVFEVSNDTILPPPNGTGFTQRYLKGSSWNSLDSSINSSQFDGIELKTNEKPFYLKYRTFNTGSGWLPYVTSIENDYAGLPNNPMEALEIKVYDNNGNSLDRKYVVMYRVYCDDKWLAWVSNASPDIMQSIYTRYNLSGTLDYHSADAGLPGSGKPINRIEIKLFENEGSLIPPNIIKPDGIEMNYLVGDRWNVLTKDVFSNQLDGIELKAKNKPYYFKYRTFNTGSGWLPYVTSNENDYAGVPNAPMEALEIKVYDNNGNSLDRKCIVMYRVHINGVWLSWVSNAAPDIMQSIQSNNKLGGTLDFTSIDAGLPGSGKPINKIEILVLEEEGAILPPVVPPPSGTLKKIFIDPGHGGNDPGAVGNGLLEKDITLKLSLYQKELFEKEGYIVKLPRTTNIYKSLKERTDMANAWGADLFISNHVNAGGGEGEEVWCSIAGGASRTYATLVERNLSTIFKSRGVKTRVGDDGRDYLHVLRETNMPAILIEHGFIDNINDVNILKNDFMLKYLSTLTVSAITGKSSNTDEIILKKAKELSQLFSIEFDNLKLEDKICTEAIFGNLKLTACQEASLVHSMGSGDLSFTIKDFKLEGIGSVIKDFAEASSSFPIIGATMSDINKGLDELGITIGNGVIDLTIDLDRIRGIVFGVQATYKLVESDFFNTTLYNKYTFSLDVLEDLLEALRKASPWVLSVCVLGVIACMAVKLYPSIPYVLQSICLFFGLLAAPVL